MSYTETSSKTYRTDSSFVTEIHYSCNDGYSFCISFVAMKVTTIVGDGIEGRIVVSDNDMQVSVSFNCDGSMMYNALRCAVNNSFAHCDVICEVITMNLNGLLSMFVVKYVGI